jgi:hypothetical protein
MKFLCVVHERISKATLAEYEIEAADWYYARHMAAAKYRADVSAKKTEEDWCVDSLELEENV